MTIQPVREFKLSPAGSGRGVSCDANGAFIDSIPLLKRTFANGRETWLPRGCPDISDELGERYGLPIDISSKAAGLSAIANALNVGNVVRAQLVALHLQFPEPPSITKDADGDERALIKFIRDLDLGGLIKANWDADEHPRWPAGAPDSQGGRFAPKGEGGGASDSGRSPIFASVNRHARSRLMPTSRVSARPRSRTRAPAAAISACSTRPAHGPPRRSIRK